VHNGKPGVVVRDRARYLRVDARERTRRIAEWNHPVWWPLLALAAGVLAVLVRTRRAWRARETATALGGVR
jgi:hypothetical protein